VQKLPSSELRGTGLQVSSGNPAQSDFPVSWAYGTLTAGSPPLSYT